MWEEEGAGNPEAEWLKDVAQAMEEAVPEQEVGKINITEETITEVLKKKKNWSAPGWNMQLLAKETYYFTQADGRRFPGTVDKARTTAELALRRKNNIDPERGRMGQSQLSPHHVHEYCL